MTTKPLNTSPAATFSPTREWRQCDHYIESDSGRWRIFEGRRPDDSRHWLLWDLSLPKEGDGVRTFNQMVANNIPTSQAASDMALEIEDRTAAQNPSEHHGDQPPPSSPHSDDDAPDLSFF